MDKHISRRTFGKLALGTAAATGLTPFLAHPTFAALSNRAHGVILTSATFAQLQNCISRGGYNTLKVVTGWGLQDRSMTDPTTIAQLCAMTPNTIVRTAVGDGCGTDSNPYPDQVVAQIRPWYQAKQNILIELGNEPNNKAWNGSADSIWVWRYYLDQAISACRANFPNAMIISPGLATGSSVNQWFQISSDVMRKANYVGFHAYEFYDFTGPAGPDWQIIVPLMQQYFGDVYWALTEFGINDTSQTSQATKGYRYAGLVQQGESNPQMPWNVAYATYYHLMTAPGGPDPAYNIYGAGDDAYRNHSY
ncbi:hypothetical protein KDW_49300 [Dictyobacter vulcani]|uniref:Glycoside hydrolase family 5 domain-containing protein n=1 Tax=Dictyobacter vulcani TaxID=2607529 RepID=A0A5J4KM18_9CHLR|nr:cellulase family glycosylhydrolase [Dictyobacter vulcani]GER90768.1 hypothetical protein KDW_49300 [Dictyobacter vulcani]